MESIAVAGKQYRFVCNYKLDDELRNKFNLLAQKVWGFDFEKWHKSGYWDDNCLLYSLLEDDKMVSHITVSVIEFIVLGERKKYVQLGTVMTDENYRKQGLNKILMEKVLSEWKSKCDMIYLYANNCVLDFYPKFGFVPVQEYQAAKKIARDHHGYPVRKMNLDRIDDCSLLYNIGKNAAPLFQISMVDHIGLIMFHCIYFDLSGLKEGLYYIQDLNAIAVAEYRENEIILQDILSTQYVGIDEVIQSLATDKTKEAILRCMPIHSENYEISPYKEEDITLFVMADKKEIFEKNNLIFPILSHT